MFFSEDDLKTFLNSHPNHIYDEAKSIVRKKTKEEQLNGENWKKDPNKKSLLDKLLEDNTNNNVSSSVIPSNSTSSNLVPEKEKEEKKKKKKNKYWNVKVYVYENGFISEEKDLTNNGKIVMVFDSKKEFKRWNELVDMQERGEIFDLRRQVPLLIQEGFKYEGKKITAIKYNADHIYVNKDGRTVVEDVKTFDNKTQKYRTTKDFNLKWKLLKFKYPEYLFTLY